MFAKVAAAHHRAASLMHQAAEVVVFYMWAKA